MNKIILPLIMKSTKIKIHFKLNVFTLDYFIDLNFQQHGHHDDNECFISNTLFV